MQCLSCGTTLLPGVTTCQNCGSSTSYEAETPFREFGPHIETVSTPGGSQAHQVLPQYFFNTPQTPLTEQKPQGYGTSTSPSQAHYLDAQTPSYGTPPFSGKLQPQQRRGLSATMVALLIMLVLLLIGASGLLYYATVSHPAELRAQATALVQTSSTRQAGATATASTPESLYLRATSRTPALNDPLNSQATSTWHTPKDAKGGCAFTSGAYHVYVVTNNYYLFCTANYSHFSNFAYQVQMTIRKGADGGVILRYDRTDSTSVNNYHILDLFDRQGARG